MCKDSEAELVFLDYYLIQTVQRIIMDCVLRQRPRK